MRFRTLDSNTAVPRLAIPLLLAAVGAQAGCSDDGPGSPDPITPDASVPRPDGGMIEIDAGPTPAPDAGVLIEGAVTLAGAGMPGDDDGARAQARFDNPVNVTMGPDGNVYVADFGNDSIRVVTPAGVVSTLIAQENFRRPFGMVFADDGSLYVQTDVNDAGELSSETGTLWRVDVDAGEAEVVARDLGRPRGLAALDDGRLVLSDGPRHSVFLLDPDAAEPTLTLLAGSDDPQLSGHVDAIGADARFSRPMDIVVIDDDIYLADRENHRIRKITLDGEVTTVAGTGTPGGNDGSTSEATFDLPHGLARDSAGNLYVSEISGYRIRKIDLYADTVTTIAGTGMPGHHDAEDPMQARFFGLEGIDVDVDDMYLYVADGNRGEDGAYHRVRRVSLH